MPSVIPKANHIIPNNYIDFSEFIVLSTGAVVTLPSNYATHPVFGYDLVRSYNGVAITGAGYGSTLYGAGGYGG
jgi:hypothetical protein